MRGVTTNRRRSQRSSQYQIINGAPGSVATRIGCRCTFTGGNSRQTKTAIVRSIRFQNNWERRQASTVPSVKNGTTNGIMGIATGNVNCQHVQKCNAHVHVIQTVQHHTNTTVVKAFCDWGMRRFGLSRKPNKCGHRGTGSYLSVYVHHRAQRCRSGGIPAMPVGEEYMSHTVIRSRFEGQQNTTPNHTSGLALAVVGQRH